jgi:RNA polymerase sigma-70 factor (ECF subfamily)
MSIDSSDKRRRSATEEITAKKEASRRAAAHDAELVRRFNAGDDAAFDEIVHRHRDKVFAIAQGVLHNGADAEEIAQDTFIRAHRGLRNFRGDSSLATWLHHVTVNLARNRYWYFHRRRRHATLSLDCPLSEQTAATFSDLMPSSEPQPSREAMSCEFSVLVTTCMEKLPASQREILAMRNVLNRSYDQIAVALGIEVGTVKSRIARARGQLRSLMAEACPELGENAPPSEWFEPARGEAGAALSISAN